MDRASVHTGNALEQFLQHNRTLIPECLYSFNQHNRLPEEVRRGRLHLSSDQFFTRLKSLFIYYCVEVDL